jgi:hypothetical protein
MSGEVDRMAVIERWVCPRHRGQKVKFNGGRLWCLTCKRELPDAVKVVIVPEADWRGAVAENEQLRADLDRVRNQRDQLIEHERVMTAEIDRLRGQL